MSLVTLIQPLVNTLRLKCLIQNAKPTIRPVAVPSSTADVGLEAQEEDSAADSDDSGAGFVDPAKQRWHDFLDHLSGLCHFKPAGDTVAALAMMRDQTKTSFVLAANNNSTKEPVDHLKDILGLLNTVSSDRKSQTTVISQIRDLSISRAKKKVHNYRQQLVKLIKEMPEAVKAADELPARLTSHLELYVALKQLTLPRNHVDFCRLTSRIHKSDEYRIYRKDKLRRDSRDRRIRHFIGRLCYWERASRFVVSCALDYREAIATAEVTWINCTPGPRECDAIRFDGNVRNLVAEQYPHFANDSQRLDEIVGTLESASGLLDKFAGTQQIPVVHAEAALAHHFWYEGYTFAGPDANAEDRYIGCSKPSCYCCDRYLQFHPGRFERRPSHGTAWFRWYPPISRKGDKKDTAVTKRILECMSNAMHLDVEDSIINNEFGKRREFDSTTGTSR